MPCASSLVSASCSVSSDGSSSLLWLCLACCSSAKTICVRPEKAQVGCLPSSQNRFSFTSCLTFLYAVCFRKTNRLLFFIYDFNKIGFDSNEQVCVCVCVSEHLCVCIPIQIYIIYTIFVLPFKIKRCFLIKCQSLAIKKKFPGTASCQCPCPCGELQSIHTFPVAL